MGSHPQFLRFVVGESEAWIGIGAIGSGKLEEPLQLRIYNVQAHGRVHQELAPT